MNRKKLLISSMFVFLLAGLLSHNYALGSWIKMYPKDLSEKSDVILIGEISGPIGVEKRKASPPPNLWVTNWNVRVHYYLKGSENNRELIVSTPGVKNQPHVFHGFDNRFLGGKGWSSNDFQLDLNGNLVLLFLNKDSSTLQPLSPQGIISLALNKTGNERNQFINGEDIVKQYTISNQSVSEEEVEQIKDLIKQAQIAIPSVDVPPKYSVDANYSTLDIIIIVATSLLIVITCTVLVAVFLMKRKA